MTSLRRLLLCLLSLAIAAAIWLPCVHFFFAPDLDDYHGSGPLRVKTTALAARHLRLWAAGEERSGEIDALRRSNPEWDFMGRTFLVMSLSNMALREPQNQAEYLLAMDRIIDDTLRVEAENGPYYFLMGYAQSRPFVEQPVRSLFVDGEIAMMLACRQMIEQRAAYGPLLAKRIDAVTGRMQRGPILCAESYPDECWMFCNTMALVAVRMSDVVDGRDHSALVGDWLAMAKRKLIDPDSGMLVSSFTLDGRHLDGPEGSSIFFVAHCLMVFDEPLARDQYARARKELGKTIAGFGYAREWPASWVGPTDIDSGPIVPILEASAGASGFAILGASTFGDDAYLRRLLTSLHFAAFPIPVFPRQGDGNLRFAASNQVGDAMMLYGLVHGPLWQRVKKLSKQIEKRSGR